jgi:multidrug efflux pump subunit AcrA (membrane-fusion protein)
MRDKLKSFWAINKKRKRTWVILALVVIAVLYFIFKTPSSVANTVTDIAKVGDLKQTVLATGQVVSNTDLNLSFNATGVVKSLKVKVGDKVKTGQVLATLDQGAQQASLTSARGALAAANARLKRTIEGASNEEIALSEIALSNEKRDYENVKTAQSTLVQNAYDNMLNSTLEAIPKDGTSDYVAPIISGNYNLGKEGTINLTSYYSTGGVSFTATGLTTGNGISNTIIAQPIGDSGLYIKFPNNTNINVNEWVINIPNKKASNYLMNYNAYQSALKAQSQAISLATSDLEQAQAQLNAKVALARPEDISIAKAQINSATGALQIAQGLYNNNFIYAPTDGVVTVVSVKEGEIAMMNQKAIGMTVKLNNN